MRLSRKVIDIKLRALHNQLYKDGVAARKQQKANSKEVAELQKAKQPIPEALLNQVYDPSKDQAQLIKKVELDWLEAQAEGSENIQASETFLLEKVPLFS
jgi:hypothetical protein